MDNETPIYAFQGQRLLLRREGEELHVPCQGEVTACNEVHEVLMNDGRRVLAVAITEAEGLTKVSEGSGCWALVDLRRSFYSLPLADYQAAGKAWEILYWDSHSRFCPACGTPTRRLTPIMKRCLNCQHELYPPVATAVIVLIRRGEEVLLVRARNFRGNFYGLVAGFVEAGESLEECVRREVREETSLEIANITYFGSQPWPYPCGLMVGFVADYASGTLRLQDEELSTAAFFTRHNLPEIPQKLSIARRLIDWWLSQG